MITSPLIGKGLAVRAVVYWLILFTGVVVAVLGRQALSPILAADFSPEDAGRIAACGVLAVIILGAMIAKKATGGTLMRTRHWDRFRAEE